MNAHLSGSLSLSAQFIGGSLLLLLSLYFIVKMIAVSRTYYNFYEPWGKVFATALAVAACVCAFLGLRLIGVIL